MHVFARLRMVPALFALSACVEIKIVDDDGVGQGAGGAPGGSTTSISAGVGGAGGDGGSPPGPVAGCEALQLAGDPIFIAGIDHAQFPQIAAIDAAQAGLVYVDRDGFDDVLFSRVLGAPFTTWPPSVSDAVEHFRSRFFGNTIGLVRSRPDGVFSASPGNGAPHVVGTFGQPGAELWDEVVILEPTAGGGAYGIRGGGFAQHELIHRSTLSPSAPLVGLWTWDSGCLGWVDGFIAAEQMLLGLRSYRDCETPGPMSFVHISGGVATAGATWPQDLDPDEPSPLLRLLPRPGGGWVAATSQSGAEVQAIDSFGSPIGTAFRFESDIPVSVVPAAAFFDGGFALLVQGEVEEGVATARIVVSDGEGVTKYGSLPMPGWLAGSRQVTLVGSPDSTRLLVAYPALVQGDPGTTTGVLRVDCVQPR